MASDPSLISGEVDRSERFPSFGNGGSESPIAATLQPSIGSVGKMRLINSTNPHSLPQNQRWPSLQGLRSRATERGAGS
jgi:hypothetical protein